MTKRTSVLRTWLGHVAYHVALVFALTFLGSLLSAPAGITHLDTLRSASVGALTAALAALYASLGALKTPAATTVRAMHATARRFVDNTRRRRDAAGISGAAATGQLRIGLVVVATKANVSYRDLKTWLPALHTQAAAFCRSWGLRQPRLSIYATAARAAAAGVDLLITVFDDSDQAGALGYHDEAPDGVPYARVFALDCQAAGVSVSSCVSHELLEAIADTACDRWAQAPDGRLWALEVCDPVEADTYTIDGVEVSSYVLPAWFDANGHRPFDQLDRLAAPFTMSTGGYGIVMAGGKVTEVWGDRRHYRRHEGWRLPTKTSPVARTARRLGRGR